MISCLISDIIQIAAIVFFAQTWSMRAICSYTISHFQQKLIFAHAGPKVDWSSSKTP